MVEEVAPQADHDGLADRREAADEPRLQDPPRCGDAEVDDDDDRQMTLVVR